MIIYKTKYYGLLGDRVRQAIKESGRKSSDFRNYIRDREPEKITSFRTLSSLVDQRTKEKQAFDKILEEISREGREKGSDIRRRIALLDDHLFDKVNPDDVNSAKKYEILAEKLDNLKRKRLTGLKEKLQEKENKVNEARTKRLDVIDKTIDFYEKQRRSLEPVKKKYKFILNPAIDRELDKEWFNNVQKGIDKVGDDVRNKYEKGLRKLRKNPNDKELIDSVKKDFIKSGGKEENFIQNEINENSYYNPKDKSLHVGTNPGIASHENNHFKNDIDKISVDRVNGFGVDLRSPEKFFDEYKYVTKEEGGANKRGFRDIFLNKNSGGRDWRSSAHVNKASNASYYSGLGLDIDKVGIQDLDYNMSPEALKKMRENAKKLGINV